MLAGKGAAGKEGSLGLTFNRGLILLSQQAHPHGMHVSVSGAFIFVIVFFFIFFIFFFLHLLPLLLLLLHLLSLNRASSRAKEGKRKTLERVSAQLVCGSPHILLLSPHTLMVRGEGKRRSDPSGISLCLFPSFCHID